MDGNTAAIHVEGVPTHIGQTHVMHCGVLWFVVCCGVHCGVLCIVILWSSGVLWYAAVVCGLCTVTIQRNCASPDPNSTCVLVQQKVKSNA